MSLTQTAVRYSQADGNSQRLSSNLLINPSFEHMAPYGISKARTHFDVALRACPGWYDYGTEVAGVIGESPVQAPNPAKTSLAANGVTIEEASSRLRGLCQQLFRGSAIRGRRVRISGSYSVEQLDSLSSSSTGISIWLKSDKQSMLTGELNWKSVTLDGGAPTTRWNALELSGSGAEHIIRMTNNTGAETYSTGEELYNRAFDWLAEGPNGTIPLLVRYIALGGPVGDEGVPIPNITSNAQALHVWYLNNNFTGGLGSGQHELFSEVQTTTGTIVHFEAFVDIPDDPALFEDDDVWLCVFPTNPAAATSSTQAARIALWEVSLQIVLNGGSSDVPLSGSMAAPAVPTGTSLSGRPLRYMLRYPIYEPVVVPLNTHPTYVIDIVTGAYNWSTVKHDFSNPSVFMRINSFLANAQHLVANQQQLPAGSCLIRASLSKRNTGALAVQPLILQRLTHSPLVGGDLVRNRTLLQWPDIGSVVDPAWVDSQHFANRNMIGAFWPTASEAVVIESAGKLAAASLELSITYGNTTDILLSGNHIEALVDPRWGMSTWTLGV